jgi:hypothetical protein
MAAAEPPAFRWKPTIGKASLRAAEDYLTLCYPPVQAARLLELLKDGEIVTRRADDILRACRRDPAPADDPRVKDVTERMADGKALSPALVVISSRGPDIANGEHRLSAALHADPAMVVPVVIAVDEPDQ